MASSDSRVHYSGGPHGSRQQGSQTSKFKEGVVAHACRPPLEETEAGRWVQFKASLVSKGRKDEVAAAVLNPLLRTEKELCLVSL